MSARHIGQRAKIAPNRAESVEPSELRGGFHTAAPGNRRFVDRADALREIPAAVWFISAEPLLGPLESLICHPSTG